MDKIQEAIDICERLEVQPYPEDIFLPVSKEDLDNIHIMLKDKFNMPLDRLTGHIGRLLRKPVIDDAKKLKQYLLSLQSSTDKQVISDEKKYKIALEKIIAVQNDNNYFLMPPLDMLFTITEIAKNALNKSPSSVSEHSSAGVWVKASERLPDVEKEYFIRNIKNKDKEISDYYFDELFCVGSIDLSLENIEWLDESPPVKEDKL